MLEILRARGVEFDVIEYLNDPPSEETLERFLELLPNEPAELVRKDKNFKAMGLDPDAYTTAQQVIAVLLEHPKLMQRPIILRGDRAVLARPSELVEQLLD